MATILPGELVEPGQHVNLKLGPGLLQLSSPQGLGSIISTRAGVLNHSANGKKWWVESNSRRVSLARLRGFPVSLMSLSHSMYQLRKNPLWVSLQLEAATVGG